MDHFGGDGGTIPAFLELLVEGPALSELPGVFDGVL
jgi:hypothetical protein